MNAEPTNRKLTHFFTTECSVFLYRNELWRKHGGARVNVMLLWQLAEFGHF